MLESAFYKRATLISDLEAVMAGKQLRTMDVPALLALKGRIDAILAEKRRELEQALAALGGGSSVGQVRVARASNGKGRRAGRRAKAPPKYQSRKNRSLKWSGRGMLPIWMREEMKGTRLKKDDFLIK